MLRILRQPMSRDVWLLAGYNGYSCAPYITFLHTSKWPPRTISLALIFGRGGIWLSSSDMELHN